jgi:hypothetical protein
MEKALMKQTEGTKNPNDLAQGVGNFRRPKLGKFGRPLTPEVSCMLNRPAPADFSRSAEPGALFKTDPLSR